MIDKLSSLLTSNVNFHSAIEFILSVTYNRLKRARTRGDARYVKPFAKVKGKKRNFSDTIGCRLMNHP